MDYRKLRQTFRKITAYEDKQGDHYYYYLIINGKDYRIGKISHSTHNSDIVEDFVITNTARRLKLDKPEFFNLVNCSLDKNTHLKIWSSRV